MGLSEEERMPLLYQLVHRAKGAGNRGLASMVGRTQSSPPAREQTSYTTRKDLPGHQNSGQPLPGLSDHQGIHHNQSLRNMAPQVYDDRKRYEEDTIIAVGPDD